MKYCTHCGKELFDEAIVCPGCGCATEEKKAYCNNSHTTNRLLITLSEKVKTNAIIWIVIGAVQIVTGVFFIVGILNILSAISDMKYAEQVTKVTVPIVSRFEPLTMPIIVLVYNLIFGGIIGVIGSIYYFTVIRAFVMENKVEFQNLES